MRLARRRRAPAGRRDGAGCCRRPTPLVESDPRRRCRRVRLGRCGSPRALRGDLVEWARRHARLGRGARARPLRRRPPRDRMARPAPRSTPGCRPRRRAAAPSASCCSCSGHSHGWPFPRGGMGELGDGARAPCRARGRDDPLRRRGRGVSVTARPRRPACGSPAASSSPPTPSSARSAPACWRGCCPPAPCRAALQRRLRALALRHRRVQARLRARRRRSRGRRRSRARAAVVHVAGALDELTAAAQAAHRGEVPERPALVVGQQSLFDRSRAPDGQHTLYVYAHVPRATTSPTTQVAERIEAQLERFAPGFRVARARARARARRRRPSARTPASSAATSAAAPTSSTSSSSSGPSPSWRATARRCAGCTSPAPRRTPAARSTA